MQTETDTLLTILQPLVTRARSDISAARAGKAMFKTNDKLNRTRVAQHLDGGTVRGIYFMSEGESTTRLAVIDIDDHTGECGWARVCAAAEKLITECRAAGLHPHPWRSGGGKGIHLWFLWDAPQDAYSVRQCLMDAAARADLRSGAGGLIKGQVEIYPKQDSIAPGACGSQVWLPLAGARPSLPMTYNDLIGIWDVVPKTKLTDKGYLWSMSGDVVKLDSPQLPARIGISAPEELTTELSRIKQLLDALEADRDAYHYDRWLETGMAIHGATAGADAALALWDDWSSRGANYEPGMCARKWQSFTAERAINGSGVGLKTLEYRARGSGWQEPVIFEDLSASHLPARSGFAEPGGSGGHIVPRAAGTAGAAGASGTHALTLPGLDGAALITMPAFQRNDSGEILPSTANIVMALEWRGWPGPRLRYDTFKDTVMVYDPRSGKPAEDAAAWRPFADTDYTDLKMCLENRGAGMKTVSRLELRECVRAIAMRSRFDSAQEWLAGLVWDGRPRIERFLEDYWAAPIGDEYVRAVSLYMWTAMAGRVMQPGCKVDMMPILVSDEGTGKSSGVQALVPSDDLFAAIDFSEKDDDLARKLRGVLVAEAEELRGLWTKDLESIYAFITRRVEKWTPKYVEYSTTFPRRVFFIGSTNDDQPLSKDGRRWLPVCLGARAGRKESDARIEDVIRDRDQLWAEALARWKDEGILWRQVSALAGAAREQFIATHPWEESITRYLETVPNSDMVFSMDLFRLAIGLTGRTSAMDSRQLSAIMRKLGYKNVRNKKTRGWVREY